MGVEKISEQINKKCEKDQNMKKMLNELFQFQLEGSGWWKEPYREIIRKFAKEEMANDENQ